MRQLLPWTRCSLGTVHDGHLECRRRTTSSRKMHVALWGSFVALAVWAISRLIPVGPSDVDEERLGKAADSHKGVKKYGDLRKLYDDKDIDAVVIATCNHWHVLAAIWACQAGKDVYVEKPLSHNHWEGQQLVNAARKLDRIVQMGSQQRSDPMQTELKQYLHEDKKLVKA